MVGGTGSTAAPRDIAPSGQQRRIVSFVRRGRGHGVVQATAGAGKTSTLVLVARSLPPNLRSCFLAFGRDAAAELARRLPPGALATTVHALGRRTLARSLAARGSVLRKVERGKYRRLARAELERCAGLPAAMDDAEEALEYLLALQHLARLELVDAADTAALADLARRHSIIPPSSRPSEGKVQSLLPLLLAAGEREALEEGIVDFTDMLHLPIALELEPPRFDFVCVDEAQDYSALALRFTKGLVDERAGGRVLFVGDPRQSIFGFAGARSEAMAMIGTDLEAEVLPLSVSYRCPRSHVELARVLAPEMEASPHAPPGRVYWISERVLENWTREGDMVLCRANAPLVQACLRLARSGKRAFVRGRDLARQLERLGNLSLAGGTGDATERLRRFAADDEKRLRRSLGGSTRLETILAERRDMISCLRYLLEDLPTRATAALLRDRIEATFAESGNAVCLSTIHRAKGREADRVLLLHPELLPAPYARTELANRGEHCVQFVALTRAKRDLVFVWDRGAATTGPRPSDRGGAPAGSGGWVGQGQGPWREVLERAWAMARSRR